MKKLIFTAICAMAFANGFASKDVKEVTEDQIAFFGSVAECTELAKKATGVTEQERMENALLIYETCRSSTLLDEIVIDVPKKKSLSQN
jgi:hypothetical protein